MSWVFLEWDDAKLRFAKIKYSEYTFHGELKINKEGVT